MICVGGSPCDSVPEQMLFWGEAGETGRKQNGMLIDYCPGEGGCGADGRGGRGEGPIGSGSKFRTCFT